MPLYWKLGRRHEPNTDENDGNLPYHTIDCAWVGPGTQKQVDDARHANKVQVNGDDCTELAPEIVRFLNARERPRVENQNQMRFPWHHPDLVEWSIVGMNHYHVDGKRLLFVAMVRSGCCIKAESDDEAFIWEHLAELACAANAALEHLN